MSLSQLHCYKYWVNEVHNYSLLTDQKDYCQQAKAIIPFVNIGKRKEKNEVKANKFGLVAIQFCEHTHLKGLTLLAHVIANLLNHVFKNKSYIINTLSHTHEMQGRGGGRGLQGSLCFPQKQGTAGIMACNFYQQFLSVLVNSIGKIQSLGAN